LLHALFAVAIDNRSGSARRDWLRTLTNGFDRHFVDDSDKDDNRNEVFIFTNGFTNNFTNNFTNDFTNDFDLCAKLHETIFSGISSELYQCLHWQRRPESWLCQGLHLYQSYDSSSLC
jgi:hypothetical protein